MATVAYNGTTGVADSGYSADVPDLNIFYDVRLYLWPRSSDTAANTLRLGI